MKYSVVGFGSQMTDWVVNLDTKRLNLVNAELRKVDSSIPQITLAGGHYDVPEVHAALKEIIVSKPSMFHVKKVPGGSVYNTSSAAAVSAKALFPSVAKNITFHHIPTTIVEDALVFNLPSSGNTRGKFLCAVRPKNEVALSDDDIAFIKSTDVFWFPLSTANGYPAQTRKALQIIDFENGRARVMATFHGYNTVKTPVKNWDVMMEADAWVGNVDELGARENKEKRDQFNNVEGDIQVTTFGENGVGIRSGSFWEVTPAVPVEKVLGKPVKGTAGAGNGVEGATILKLLNLFEGSEADQLRALGRLANAAGAAATTFEGTTLKPYHARLIKKAYNYQLGLA